MGLGDRLRVVHILPGSPAAAAGLLAGDQIERVGLHNMPVGKTASTALALVLKRKAVDGATQTFRVRRGDTRHPLEIVPRPRCDIDLIVTESDHVNDFNYGQSIYMTDGLMRFLSDDQQLAAVVAHLVAHVLLEHETIDGELTAQIGGLQRVSLGQDVKNEMKKVGTLPGAQPYSKLQEIEADWTAIELLMRAGYPTEVLVEVWQRLAEVENGPVLLREFHTLSQERQEALQYILESISRKF